MAELFKPLLERSFLASALDSEFQTFKNTDTEKTLLARLEAWNARTIKGETKIEAAFIGRFFEETWGYRPDGQGPTWTLQQQFAIPGAGAGGAGGSADLALGNFGEGGTMVPQVLCEFKGVGSDLDKAQARKGNTRSPARQALDYLSFARRGFFESAAVQPRFAIVTDMDQFRLYWADRPSHCYISFRIGVPDQSGFFETNHHSLLGMSEEDRFERFLFWRLFRPDMLLSDYGRTRLERLIERQGANQKRLENKFYGEYQAYRLRLYNIIKLQPLGDVSNRDRLRLAQKLLDRLIFVMFTEDMGGRVAFPPHLLRDMLVRESIDRFYEPDDTRIWKNLRRLFRAMDAGGAIGDDQIHRFNGGLFETDALIDRLELPNHLFCTRGQGRVAATIEAEKETLLYLAATYNFASDGDSKNSIGLYTLGHIFEQSLVDLEVLEAEAEERLSLSVITKRKRDGVYYTPEPIVLRIIEETIAPLLAQWRTEAGWPEIGEPSPKAAKAYWERLSDIRIVDPACGSGAFLITAYAWLFAEFRRVHDKRRELGIGKLVDDAEITRHILATNLYGVDINPLSVEITQLSLWLHTARARQPLSRFEQTIQCGNSLVDERLYQRHPDNSLSDAARARIAPFDWDGRFPEIAARGGFDAVIGNPPYVKLQHFRRVYAETALYLRDGVNDELPYRSTQTGNFDLYLPFIEKGLALLKAGGRMGYIAPNLWPTLEYGQGLRQLVVEGQHLERWIDFRSHQVFEEATIYTAIQIFTKSPSNTVSVIFARDGDLAKINWATPDAQIAYDDLDADGDTWLLAPAPVRALMHRLGQTCYRLDDPAVTSGINVGIQTSADYIYHLEKRANGRYLHKPPKVGKVQPPVIEVDIEDAIMKPLISGAEAKRFIAPATNTYLLFPYQVDEEGARLWSPEDMAARFPKAWAWLKSFEKELRARENKSFDDDQWYRFGRSQNIDKQEIPKLIVPRLVPSLRLSIDATGELYCDNVDVGGVVAAEGVSLSYIAGMLGSPANDFLFRWLSKPLRGDFLSANKQFIAPLPIPKANDEDRGAIARIAESLQTGYTRRAHVRRSLGDRLSSVARRSRPYEWLLPEVQSKQVIEAERPRGMGHVAAQEYADRLQDDQIVSGVARIDDLIRLDSVFEAQFVEGELIFFIDNAPSARGIYADADQGAFWLAQWQAIALGFEPNGRGNGKRLLDQLRSVADEAPPVLRTQIIEYQSELSAIAVELSALEANLHDISCRLFDLSPAERQMVEARI
jgi:hypothetical protein